MSTQIPEVSDLQKTDGTDQIDTESVSNTNEDDELDDRLTSALGDFQKPVESKPTTSKNAAQSSKSKSKGSKKGSSPSSSSEIPKLDFDKFSNVDDVLKSFMEQDPQLRQHWEQLADSCTKAAEASTDEEFESSLNDTLKNLTENAKSIAENSDMSPEELARIWENLGINDGGGAAENGAPGLLPDIIPLVTNMMQNLLSKEVFYPALKDLTAKYPQWLTEKKEKVPESALQRYSLQLTLMRQVCDEFDSERDSDSSDTKKERFQKILAIMQKMQECGSPPKDLVGDVPDLGTPGSDFDFSKIPGFQGAGAPGQCSIM